MHPSTTSAIARCCARLDKICVGCSWRTMFFQGIANYRCCSIPSTPQAPRPYHKSMGLSKGGGVGLDETGSQISRLWATKTVLGRWSSLLLCCCACCTFQQVIVQSCMFFLPWCGATKLHGTVKCADVLLWNAPFHQTPFVCPLCSPRVLWGSEWMAS